MSKEQDEALYVLHKILSSCAAALQPTSSERVRAVARQAALDTLKQYNRVSWEAANRLEASSE